MAGYIGYSMSVNAANAYESGKLPASKIAAALKIKGVKITAADVTAVVTPSEWHHTSKKYNKTNFFDLAECQMSICSICKHARRQSDEQRMSDFLAALAADCRAIGLFASTDGDHITIRPEASIPNSNWSWEFKESWKDATDNNGSGVIRFSK